MKRYSMQYESDEINRMSNIGEHNHLYGYARTIKTARAYIAKCRKREARHNPRNFRIYDHESEVNPETNYVSCVYQED